jgi:hypothetical protein
MTHPWYTSDEGYYKGTGGIGGKIGPRRIGNVSQYLKPRAKVYDAKGLEKTILHIGDLEGNHKDSHLTFTDNTEDYFMNWFTEKPRNIKENRMKNLNTFESFINEKASTSHGTQDSFIAGKAKKGTYRSMVSKKVQDSIKKLCESMLHEEACKVDANENKDHTYEKYVKECGSYMNECMSESMEIYRNSKSTAGMK